MALLLLDDHFPERLAAELNGRGHDAKTTRQLELHQLHDDEALWRHAIRLERVMVTYNLRDFVPPSQKFAEQGLSHRGLILFAGTGIRQNDYGSQLRAIEDALQKHPEGRDWTVYATRFQG